MDRHIWTMNYADIEVWRLNSSGALMDSESTMVYCYANSLTLSATAVLERRAVSGRPRRIISRKQSFDDCSLDIGHLFYRKADEYDRVNVFSIAQMLRLIVRFTDITYSGSSPLENDVFTLDLAYAQKFSITGSDNSDVTGSATFIGELLT